MGTSDGQDLVVISLPGVQRFIAESRTTRDLAHASRIVSDLADILVTATSHSVGAELVVPARRGGAVSNKIAVLTEAGHGADLAVALAAHARRWWARRTEALLGSPSTTANFPTVNWVCVAAEGRSYSQQWDLATASLADRRQLRNFTSLDEASARHVCSVTGRWAALPAAPPGTPAHDRDDSLSAVAWVKRRWSTDTVPSTSVIATAPYRAWIANHLELLPVKQAVNELRVCAENGVPPVREYPLAWAPSPTPDPELRWVSHAGQWVQEDAWTVRAVEQARLADPARGWPRSDASASTGRRLARELRKAVEDSGGPSPARYLALVAQDLDDMGKRLSGVTTDWQESNAPEPLDPDWHRRLSQQLTLLAGDQRRRIEGNDHRGKVIYAGGDDLLAIVPASTALSAAVALQADLARFPDLPTASTAIFFFHQNGNLSTAVRNVHEMLARAKETSPSKHGLAVGFQRRSGSSYEIARPWSAPSGSTAFIDLLEALRNAGQMSLTSGLLNQLRRDQAELESLAYVDQWHLELEVRRLVKRHMVRLPGESTNVRDLVANQWSEAIVHVATSSPIGIDLVGAMRIGLFLRQECR